MPTAPATFRLMPKRGAGKSMAVEQRCNAYRTEGWKQLRLKVLARDGLMCRGCGKVCMNEKEAHCDHIVPAKDETEVMCDMSNLQTLCASCHSRKTRREQTPGGK